MWYIGQRVVCVNDRFPSQILDWASNLPRNGQIYTIQSISWGVCLYTRRSTLGFYLHELPNPPRGFGFRADRFAPLLEKLDEACQAKALELNPPAPLPPPMLIPRGSQAA
jgi:hypothetical protein